MTQAHIIRLLRGAAGLCLVLHVGVALASAVHAGPNSSPLATPYRVFGEMTGAYSSFGFFAPSVASQVRASMQVRFEDGSVEETQLSTGSTEIDLRLHTMLGFFPVQEARELFGQSWAARGLALPGAAFVTVYVDVFELPPMEKYDPDAPRVWRRFYEESFVRVSHNP